MRYVVLDTETTGLEVRQGHRLIEIGCVELQNRKTSGGQFHEYINPERTVDPGAFAVHGISDDALRDKPKFLQISEAFIQFIRNSTLIIHNASFDIGFLDHEFERIGLGSVRQHVTGVVDTLSLARELFPGKRNNLDALCERYGIQNKHRTFHGALLDAQLLAEVYLAMTRGQNSLLDESQEAQETTIEHLTDLSTLKLAECPATVEETAAHNEYLAILEKQTTKKMLWG